MWYSVSKKAGVPFEPSISLYLQFTEEPLDGTLAHCVYLAAVECYDSIWPSICPRTLLQTNQPLSSLQQNPQNHKPGLHVCLRQRDSQDSIKIGKQSRERVKISAHSHISPVSSSCSLACRTPAPAGRHAPCSASSHTQPPLHPPLHARKHCRTHKLLSIHISTILAE